MTETTEITGRNRETETRRASETCGRPHSPLRSSSVPLFLCVNSVPSVLSVHEIIDVSFPHEMADAFRLSRRGDERRRRKIANANRFTGGKLPPS